MPWLACIPAPANQAVRAGPVCALLLGPMCYWAHAFEPVQQVSRSAALQPGGQLWNAGQGSAEGHESTEQPKPPTATWTTSFASPCPAGFAAKPTRLPSGVFYVCVQVTQQLVLPCSYQEREEPCSCQGRVPVHVSATPAAVLRKLWRMTLTLGGLLFLLALLSTCRHKPEFYVSAKLQSCRCFPEPSMAHQAAGGLLRLQCTALQ